MHTRLNVRARLVVVPFVISALLGGCASAPDSYTDLPLQAAPMRDSSSLPKLRGAVAAMEGKMIVTSSITDTWIANSAKTILYQLRRKRGSEWHVASVLGWSVYHNAYCEATYEDNDQFAIDGNNCLVELNDNAGLFKPTTARQSNWGYRMALESGKMYGTNVNFENGKAAETVPYDLVPSTIAPAELKNALGVAQLLETKFQDHVSSFARDAARYARWQRLRDEDRQSAREFNAFMSALNEELQTANAEAEANVAQSTASLNETLARLRQQEQARSQAAASAAATPTPSRAAANVAGRVANARQTLRSQSQPTQSQQSRVRAETAAAGLRQAAQAAEQQRKTAAAEEVAVREHEAEQRRRRLLQAAEERQARAEAEKVAARERDIANYLTRLRSSIRLAAKSCGKDDVRIGGTIPGGKQLLETVKVNYIGHCPGQVRFTGAINNYIGDGVSCVGSDMRALNNLPCEPEKARFEVQSVTRSD